MNYKHHSLLMGDKWGKDPDEFDDINKLMDSSKTHYPHWSHRCITHNSFFIVIAERIYGDYISGIPTRDVVVEHIKQDCGGVVPTIQDWLKVINVEKPKWAHPNKHYIDKLNTLLDA